MEFGCDPSEREGMSGKLTMVGKYFYQGYPGKGQQHRYTTLTNIPPSVRRVSTVLFSGARLD